MSFAIGKTQLAYARLWHLVDAKGQILGNLSRGIATVLTGEHKPIFDPSNDCGDYIVVINAKDVVVSGNKEETKVYHSHSGYEGGLKSTPYWLMMEKKPEEIIRKAVMGMVPKNKLRKKRMARLLIFPDKNHPYGQNIARFYDDLDLEKLSSADWCKMSANEMMENHNQIQRSKILQLIAEEKK